MSSLVLPPGYGVDAGAALHFTGRELAAVVASKRDARAFRVQRGPDGSVTETPLDSRRLV